MDKRFVVAVFVARAELQMAVQKKTEIVFETRQHKMLIAAVACKDNLIGINVVFGGGGDFFGLGHAHGQSAQDHNAGHPQTASSGKLFCKQKSAPQLDCNIDQPKKHRGTHQSEARHQKNGKEQGSRQGAEVVKGQNVSDYVAEIVTVADDTHQQRNFQAHEYAHDDDQSVEDQLEALRESERQHQ